MIAVIGAVGYVCLPPVLAFVRIELRARAVRKAPNVAEIAAALIELVKTTDGRRMIYGNETNAIPPVLRPPGHGWVLNYTGEYPEDTVQLLTLPE